LERSLIAERLLAEVERVFAAAGGPRSAPGPAARRPIAGRLHHISIGRTHAQTRILILVQDLDIRIINAATGELLREFILDPTRD